MAVLLLGEVTDGALALDATAKAVSAAKALGDVTVLCAGASAADAGAAAAKIDGVAKVLVAEDAALGHRLAEATAALIVSLAGDYSHIVAPATTDAKNVMPRVAALLDAMVISDVEMPDMDGYRLATEIRADARLARLPIVLHTSLSGVFNQALVQKVGADHFVPKFSPDELAAAVKACLQANPELRVLRQESA